MSIPSPPKVSSTTLLLNITPKTLNSEISAALKIPYLSDAAEGMEYFVPATISGIVYNDGDRMMLPLIVASEIQGKKIRCYVHFLLDTGAPVSYLSDEAWERLRLDTSPAKVVIHGAKVKLQSSPRGSIIEGINLLGMDLWKTILMAGIERHESTFTARFDDCLYRARLENEENKAITKALGLTK